MMKLNIEETLSAQTYAAYMIASSYFDSYVCVNKQMERQTYILYRMLGADAQSKMEVRIISLMEKGVLPRVPREFLASRVEVRFLPDRSGILITDGFGVLEIRQVVDRRVEQDKFSGIEREKYNIRIVAKYYDEPEEGALA